LVIKEVADEEEGEWDHRDVKTGAMKKKGLGGFGPGQKGPG